MDSDHSQHLHYNVNDLSGNGRKGHLHGKLVTSNDNLESSKFAHLGNDITNIELEEGEVYKPKDYIDVIGGSDIFTNSLTVAMWVNFRGESNLSESLIQTKINAPTEDESKRFAFMVNVNDSEGDDDMTGMLGYTWNNTQEVVSTEETNNMKWKYQFVSLEQQIPKNKWVWLVLMLYPSGLSRLFVDNVYTASFNEGYVRDKIYLKNLEIGRFSGFVDSVYVFSENLDYGNVEINQSANFDLSYLYNTSRTTPFSPKQVTAPFRKSVLYGGLPFYYMETEEYILANTEYQSNTQSRIDNGEQTHSVIQSQTQEQLNLQKYTLDGGSNSGVRVFADNKFMTFTGELREKT